MLKTGLKNISEMTVTEKDTAAAWGSGLLPVYATPAMILFMEMTASKSVEPLLEEGCTTVGVAVDIKHLAATPVGMNVRCESELIKIDGKRLVFKVAVYDEAELAGEGTHERVIVRKNKFMDRVKAKAAAPR